MDMDLYKENDDMRREEELRDIASLISKASHLRRNASLTLDKACKKLRNLKREMNVVTADRYQAFRHPEEADSIISPYDPAAPFDGINDFDAKFRSTRRFACGYLAMWLSIFVATCYFLSPLFAVLAIAWCVAKDMCLYSLIIEHIWNTDDDDLILSERFARNAVESVGLVLAMYFGFEKKAILLWAVYSVAYFVRNQMKVSPHQNAKGFQPPFPMRPADASQCEIQRSFGFDFVAMSSSVITVDWDIHNVLIDVIRYLMLFEAVNNQNSWLAMGLAVFTFTTSLCYTIPPLARPWVIREAWARRSLIIREHIFTEKADHYQPSINELVSY